ncbi:unnamed protein product [Amoebophrya sp. A120]|nr:unnamed protein product [Amoebophrya sp. A120]|eukprot:GSA120T00024325001.1
MSKTSPNPARRRSSSHNFKKKITGSSEVRRKPSRNKSARNKGLTIPSARGSRSGTSDAISTSARANTKIKPAMIGSPRPGTVVSRSKSFYCWMLLCNCISSVFQFCYYTKLLFNNSTSVTTNANELIFCELVLAMFKMSVELYYKDWRLDRWDLHIHHFLSFLATALCLEWIEWKSFPAKKYSELVVHGLSIHFALVFTSVKRIFTVTGVSAPGILNKVDTVDEWLKRNFSLEVRKLLDSISQQVLLLVWLPVVGFRSLGILYYGLFKYENSLVVLVFGVLFLMLDLNWTRWDLYREAAAGIVARLGSYRRKKA